MSNECLDCQGNGNYKISVCSICGLQSCGHSYSNSTTKKIVCPSCNGTGKTSYLNCDETTEINKNMNNFLPNLYIDMDHTINYLWKSFYLSLLCTYGSSGTFKHLPEESILTSYHLLDNIEHYKHFSPEDKRKVYNKIFSQESFWRNIPVIIDSIDVVRRLDNNPFWNVFIVTAPWTDYEKCYEVKIDWLKKFFPFIDKDQVIFTQNKEILRPGILIDDSPKFLESFSGETICLKYPYNENCKVDFKANNWLEIEDYLNNKYGEYYG
jgi:5'(3')-deoxyribonucleotidase